VRRGCPGPGPKRILSVSNFCCCASFFYEPGVESVLGGGPAPSAVVAEAKCMYVVPVDNSTCDAKPVT